MKIIFFTLFLVISYLAFSQATFTSNGSANWNNKTNWVLTGTDSDTIPDSNDDVVILNSHIITLNTSGTVKSLTVNSGGTFNFAGNPLNLYGNFTNTNGTLQGSVNTLSIFSNCTISSTSNFNFGNTYGIYIYNNNTVLTIASGTSITSRIIRYVGSSTILNNNGNLTTEQVISSNVSNQLNNNSGSNFNLNSITGSIQIQSGLTVTNSDNSTFSFLPSSGSTFNLPSYTYYNIILNGSAIKNSNSVLSVNNLTNNTGTLTMGANNLTISGNLSNSGTISQTTGTVSVSGTTTCSGTSAITVGTLNQTGDFTVSSGTLNFGSTTGNLSGNLSNSGTISSSGTINVAGNLSNSGSISSGTFNIAGSLTFSGSGNLASNNTSTIVLNGSSPQTITIPVATTVPFNNLTCSNSGGASFSGGNLNIMNNLNLTSGNLSLGNRLLSIGGNISASGEGNLATGAGETNTITINGTSAQTITNTTGSALNIYNLTCNKTNATPTITLSSGNLNVNNNLTITAGTLSMGANNMTLTGNLNNAGTISSTGTLNIGGNVSFTGSGTMSGNNTVNLNGTSAQSFSTASSLTFYNLTCNNNAGVTLSSGTYTLRNILTVSTGTFNAGTNLLTMLSDASSTAIIGNSAGSITGSFIIQRYMAPCVYRKFDLGSPVTSATINDWDNELFMSIGASDDGSSPAYLGGDGSAGGSSSVFIYNNQLTSSRKYVAVTTGTTLTPGRGYQTVIADDLTGFPGRVIDTRGTPNMGLVSLPVFRTGTDGFNLVSNPFQAEIDWASVTKSNVSNTVYFLEYNGTKSTYLTARENPKINPGLGFMCVATGANPSVTVTQNSKTTNTTSAFGARVASSDEQDFDIRLRISSPNTSDFNEADLYFDKKADPGFDFKDYLFGESLIDDAPVITFADAGKQIVRNYFNNDLETAIFPLSISTPVLGNYSFDLEGLYNSNDYQDAYLINNLTKEKFSLTDNKSASIYFDKVENDQFQLVLSKKSSVEEVINSTSNSISVFATSENLVIKNLANQTQQFELKVYNVLGQLLFEQSNVVSGKSELRIPTEFMKSDIYVVKLRTVEGNEITKKVVLTK